MSSTSSGLKRNQKALCTSTSTERNSMRKLRDFYWITMRYWPYKIQRNFNSSAVYEVLYQKLSDAFGWKFCVFHQKLSNNRFFFFTLKKKKISKIQLRKLGQSTSVYRYFYAILQRAAFWKGSETKPNQETNTKNIPQISRTSGLLTFNFLLYFLVQEHEAGIYAASYFLQMGLTVNCLLKEDSLNSAFQIWI